MELLTLMLKELIEMMEILQFRCYFKFGMVSSADEEILLKRYPWLKDISNRPSSLWIRKMVTLFTRLDRDENGYLSNRDIKIFANSFSKFGVLTEREEARKCKNLLQFWEKIMGDKERIELEDYIKARIPLVRRQKNGKGNNNNTIISNNNNNNNGPVDKQIDIGADIMFDSIDTNGNGTISVREFNTFFKCIFIHDDDYAQEIFSRVNTNGEGQMSREEFGYAFRDFMLNEEDSPFKELFGPLLPL